MPKGLDRQAAIDYMVGYRDGRADRRNGLQAGASRTWTWAYRTGYSDGYARGSLKK